jgi:hypothetical protein
MALCTFATRCFSLRLAGGLNSPPYERLIVFVGLALFGLLVRSDPCCEVEEVTREFAA